MMHDARLYCNHMQGLVAENVAGLLRVREVRLRRRTPQDDGLTVVVAGEEMSPNGMCWTICH